MPVANAVQALQGQVPGLNIYSNKGGGLNQKQSINVRGIGTIGEGSTGDALILIDGMEADIFSVNPQDIESISVLKDAAASSIYGSRAPFGVVLVTTKKGKAGKAQINYNNSFRLSSPINMPSSLDSTRMLYFSMMLATILAGDLITGCPKHVCNVSKITWMEKSLILLSL